MYRGEIPRGIEEGREGQVPNEINNCINYGLSGTSRTVHDQLPYQGKIDNLSLTGSLVPREFSISSFEGAAQSSVLLCAGILPATKSYISTSRPWRLWDVLTIVIVILLAGSLCLVVFLMLRKRRNIAFVE